MVFDVLTCDFSYVIVQLSHHLPLPRLMARSRPFHSSFFWHLGMGSVTPNGELFLNFGAFPLSELRSRPLISIQLRQRRASRFLDLLFFIPYGVYAPTGQQKQKELKFARNRPTRMMRNF